MNIDRHDNPPRILAAGQDRALSVFQDLVDFRDKMYEPSLIRVPPTMPVEDYMNARVPILDQGQEGACAGFGLATVANYLLRTRPMEPETTPVSPRMFYEMAKRYDEWPGEDYEGSSIRGAMKGWHKHGVCSNDLWPYNLGQQDSILTIIRAEDALKRPLGAYYRVEHNYLAAMHTALAETGILYASARVHRGWSNVGSDGRIHPDSNIVGGHAFAIVGYDREGFWIQNSWGPEWGKNGFGHLTYGDWLANGLDVWVARLGVPVHIQIRTGASQNDTLELAKLPDSDTVGALRPHIISLGNDGRLCSHGAYGTTEDDLDVLFHEHFRRKTESWSKKRLLIYAHGGLVREKDTIRKAAETKAMLNGKEIYPIFISWRTDLLSTIRNILEDSLASVPMDSTEAPLDFMRDRIDHSIEFVARKTVKPLWDEMKENALKAASEPDGGCRLLVSHIEKLVEKEDIEIHLVAHSAGSIVLSGLVSLLRESQIPIKTCSFWAPACTSEMFKRTLMPLILSQQLERFSLYTLGSSDELNDDCLGIYGKSILYLVSNALEEQTRDRLYCRDHLRGEAILGIQEYIDCDETLKTLFAEESKSTELIISEKTLDRDHRLMSKARHHGDFDSDVNTIISTIKRIMNKDTSDSNDPVDPFNPDASSGSPDGADTAA